MTQTVSPSEMSHRPANDRDRPRRLRSGVGGSLAAQGEPMVWLTGGALAVALTMIVALLAYIGYQGTKSFWPGALQHATLLDGTTYLGEITRSEWYRIEDEAIDEMPVELAAAAREARDAGPDGRVQRQLYRTENAELTNNHFDWINDFAVAKAELPAWGLVIERLENGRFYGTPSAIVIDDQPAASVVGLAGVDREAVEGQIWQLYNEYHSGVVERRAQIEYKQWHEIGRENSKIENARLAITQAKLDFGQDSPEYAAAVEQHQQVSKEVEQQFARITDEISQLQAENDQYRLVVETAQNQEAVIPLANIVRMYPPNQLSFMGKLGVYCSRWWEFLTANPREANSEGGVWPAIIGTVTMTMIMAVAVVPFGVLAALYLREYAKPGPMISIVRISINNLAGVPSIVFGVFGLGFFCYIVGAGIDETFFAARASEGNPTYGKGALIWASFTLALLTLPVVIVAAEEALAAVPNSMREGSYGCGASKWQTIRRIVLPHAMPGIMTGMILAMARGAGEVAPLMLVGALKIAPDLPIDQVFPFLHPDRSFMHLGFHVYDLGFQSQNSEAAKHLVFTTTLLLISLIAVLNLIAIWLRGRLRKRFSAGQF